MEYITFDRENKKLYYRDSITTLVDRITFDVISFTQYENQYVFDVAQKDKFKFNRIFFPLQNTVLTVI